MLLPHFSHPQTDSEKDAVDQMMADMDLNKDDKLDFTEFVGIVAALSLAIHKAFGGSLDMSQCKDE